MERIHISGADFKTIHDYNCVYVDKTDKIYNLLTSTNNQFFLSRPRRFGKSLLLSTIKYIFEGRRELFDGLSIAKTDWDWDEEKCPVIKLDMSTCVGSIDEVKNNLASRLGMIADHLGIKIDNSDSLTTQFESLIIKSSSKSKTGKVVLLIDEYDAPLLKFIGSEQVKPYQDFLKSFYTTIKVTGEMQRFCLMTGVSKFSKVSIFSALNNLVDLTMDTSVSTLLGYTHEEVKNYFPEALQKLAQTRHVKKEDAFDLLIRYYDGYCFDKSLKRVFNPVSLGKALSSSDLKSYWFETGTPGWLMSYVKDKPLNIDNLSINEADLGSFEPASPEIVAVLFQTGYLTIKNAYEGLAWTEYELGFPNLEVAYGFNTWLARAYTNKFGSEISPWQRQCRQAVIEGDVKSFVEALSSFFACIGYDLSDRLSEQAYQNITVAILRFIGLSIGAEVTTSQGRIDMVCESPNNIFIVEMKIATGLKACEKAAQDALVQIKERDYAQPYLSEIYCDKQNIYLLGIVFDCEIHNISNWKSEKVLTEQ